MTDPPSFAQIRKAIADTIEAGCETEIYCYNNIPDMNHVPALIVKPLSGNYLVSFGVDAHYEFQLFVLVGRQDADVAQDLLDSFVNHFGTDSIPAIIRSSPTLGLEGVQADVYQMTSYGGEFPNAKIPHIGAILKCRVEADP